ncbi:peroxidase 57 [Spinacia oleracea]|uniref:Peroxidase n=1 Tax=Spinacia oleracea TaxID=3562 RepID=A0A9R0J2X2_SPIOL|nr:peroxidase 57-like [Spinacia oleracea]
MRHNMLVVGLILGVILVLSQVSESTHRLNLQIGPIIVGGKGKPPKGSPTTPPTLTPPPPSPTPPPGLKVGFYKGRCPNINVDVEANIATKVQQEFRKDPTILPALLRMQFHDCFIHGCDASILIKGSSSERTAGPNLSVRGYELIDTLKNVAEATCPDTVSCSDIIAIATKEVLKMGGGLGYAVETGRRDGLVSKAQDVDLPSPFASVSESISAFAAKNFSPEEMVILLGCHTVGISHCDFFEDRLYQGSSQFDENMDKDLREELKPVCPQNAGSDNFTFLDQNSESSNIVDNSFFQQIVKQRGILPIDQALANDPQTSGFVQQLAVNPNMFATRLTTVMVKLQALDVLTGNQGQIRKVCSKFN